MVICVAIKAGRYEGNVFERRLIINILVESASAQTAYYYSYNRCQRSATSTSKAGVRMEVVASEDRYHHSYGLCIGDHRRQIIVYVAQDMSAECSPLLLQYLPAS